MLKKDEKETLAAILKVELEDIKMLINISDEQDKAELKEHEKIVNNIARNLELELY